VALRELGFERTIALANGGKTFIYSLERDSPLTPVAEKILRGSVNRADLERVRAMTGAARIYVAVHEYWRIAEEVSRALTVAGGTALPSAPYGVRVFKF
jgi:hypothetical protein